MHLIRQHSATIATLVMTALLAVWLGYSCQSCFAADVDASTSNMHAMMDCCPESVHAEVDLADMDGCQNNASQDVPALSADSSQINIEKLIPIVIAGFYIDTWRPAEPAPVRGTPPDLATYSDRNFQSYRILLI